MSKLGLGTVQFGLNYGINNRRGQVSRLEVTEILDYAESKGISFLDTAFAYGDSEERLGDYFTSHDCNFKVISKLPAEFSSTVSTCFRESLKRLKLPVLYGYMFHDFNTFYNNRATLQELITLKRAGLVQKIGFSLYRTEELDFLFGNDVEFDLLQIPYNIFDRRFEVYFAELKDRGVEIHTRSSFLQGLVFKNRDSLSNQFEPIKDKLDILKGISLESGLLISTICLSFCTLNPYIDKVVIGVDSLDNLKDNIVSLDYTDKVGELLNRLTLLEEHDESVILPSNWK